MGDILGAIFGTSSTTSQTTQPDAIGSAMNFEKLKELVNLFSTGSLNQFSGVEPGSYSPDSNTWELIDRARDLGREPLNYSNMMSLDDYKRSFSPTTYAYDEARRNLDQSTYGGLNDARYNYDVARGVVNDNKGGAIARSYSDYGRGSNTASEAYNRGIVDVDTAYRVAMERGDYDLARSLSLSNANTDRALGTNRDIFSSLSQQNSNNAQLDLLRSEANTARGLSTSDANYQRAIDLSRQNMWSELGTNYGVAGQGYQANSMYADQAARRNQETADRAYDVNRVVADQGLKTNQYNLLASLGLADRDAAQSLSTQEANRARALELGIGATGNYVDQIARPRLEQVMALQGLERGGALPASIARATAEHAMPYLQSIEGVSATNQANTLNQLMGLKGSLSGQFGGADAAILQQLLGAQGDVSTTLQGQQGNVGTTLQGVQGNITNILQQLQAAATGRGTTIQAAAGQQLSAEQAAALSQLTGLQGDIGSQLMALQNALGTQYAGNQANTLNQNSAQQAAASQTTQQGNQALSGQRMGARTTLASGYQDNVGQLAQALMANNVSLEQAGIAANSALGQQLMQAQTALRTQQQQGITSLANTYGTNASNFAQSLPNASTQLTMLPVQARAGQSAILNSLQPLVDFPRQLREADFLRRQGLFTTAFTGIPYTPGGTVKGGSATGNIFDQLSGTIGSAAAPGGNINR